MKRLSLLLLTLVQCRHRDPDPITPASQLPQATQTGAGTIGFLLNSQPFLPSGNNGTPNFLTTYDPTYHGGNLDIRTYRYIGNTDKSQYLAFGGDSINQIGTYTFASSTFPATSSHTVYFFDNSKNSPCDAYDFRPGTKYWTAYNHALRQAERCRLGHIQLHADASWLRYD